MADRPLADTAARDRAADPGRSAIVQAPAGSGKTTLLVERYLNLLTTVSKPEEILAITFTRKAAAEMRARIINELADAKSPRTLAILERSATLGWALPGASNRLKVQTIDSFAAALARRLPTASGLSPNARFTERAGSFYAQAAERLFARIETNDDFAEELLALLEAFDGRHDRAVGLIASMLARRDQWLDPVQLVMGGTTSGAVDVLAESIERGVRHLTQSIISEVQVLLDDRQQCELDALAAYAAANLSKPWRDANAYQVAEWRFIGELTTKATGELRSQVNKNQGFPTGDAAKKAMKERMRALLDTLQGIGADELLANLKQLPEPSVAASELARLRLFSLSLVLATLELQTLFREAGAVDFTELTFASYRALGSEDAPTDLALALDARLSHLLVDEFQDTSIAQFRLIERLTREWSPGDGRTFFAVGDPMQSIYRFRDADVSLFLRTVDQGIGMLRPEALELSSNFRAGEGLVRWVNEIFEPAFHGVADPLLGRVAYAESTPTQAHSGEVNLWLTSVERPADETEQMLTTIARLQSDHPGESVAVLVRNRSHLRDLLPRLDAAGTPWEGHEIDPLSREPVVMDLLELMRMFADPTNHVARLAVLRAPFVGLTLPDLLTLVDEQIIDDPWHEWAQRDLPQGLSDDGRARLNRVLPALEAAQRRYAQLPLRRWLENLWLMLGGADAYPDHKALRSAARFFDYLEETDPRGLQVDAVAAVLGDLYATPEPITNAVKVMTIHKAKGLEFDHVVIPGLDRSSSSDEPPMLLWRAEGNDVLMATSSDKTSDAQQHSLYRWLRFEERERDANERTRLLYVAATRAKRSLHLLARTNLDKPRMSKQSLLGRVWPQLHTQAQISRTSTTPQQHTLIESSPRLRLPADYRWQRPEKPKPLKFEPAFQSTTSAAAGTTRLMDVAVGVVVHAALKRLAELGLADDPLASDVIADQRPVWRFQLINEGLTGSRLDAATEEVSHNIAAVLADADGRWLLSRHPQAASEAAFTGIFEGKLTNIVVDRTFVDDDDNRWIVDFKSSTPKDDDLDAFVADQQTNHAAQLRRYREMLAAVDNRRVIAALYFTRPAILSLLD